MQGKEHVQEDHVEWHSPRKEMIQGILVPAWHPSKTKRQLLQSPNWLRNWQEWSQPMKTKHVPFPTHSHQVPWEFLGWQRGEYGRNRREVCKLKKLSRRTMLSDDILPGEKLCQGYWRCLAPFYNLETRSCVPLRSNLQNSLPEFNIT